MRFKNEFLQTYIVNNKKGIKSYDKNTNKYYKDKKIGLMKIKKKLEYLLYDDKHPHGGISNGLRNKFISK